MKQKIDSWVIIGPGLIFRHPFPNLIPWSVNNETIILTAKMIACWLISTQHWPHIGHMFSECVDNTQSYSHLALLVSNNNVHSTTYCHSQYCINIVNTHSHLALLVLSLARLVLVPVWARIFTTSSWRQECHDKISKDSGPQSHTCNSLHHMTALVCLLSFAV